MGEATWLNPGEVPGAQNAAGACTDGDCNSDGIVSVGDYAEDSRISSGCKPSGVVVPSSLHCAFADGTDTDGNGFRDGFFGWDF